MQLRQYNQTRKALSDAQETIDRLMKTVFDAELQLKLSQAQVHAHEALVVVTRPDNLD